MQIDRSVSACWNFFTGWHLIRRPDTLNSYNKLVSCCPTFLGQSVNFVDRSINFQFKVQDQNNCHWTRQKLDQIDKEVDAGMKSRTNKSQKPEEKMEQHETVENRFTGSYAGY